MAERLNHSNHLQGAQVSVGPEPPTPRGKRALYGILLTFAILTAMLAAWGLAFNSMESGLEWYELPTDDSLRGSVLAMEWGSGMRSIHLCTIQRYHNFDIESGSYMQSTMVSNNTGYYTYYGAIDLTVLPGDELYFATEGPYGEVIRYNQDVFVNASLANMTEAMAFRCIAWTYRSPSDYLFLGGPETGLVIYQLPWMNVSFRTTQDGLADNTITCLKVRGDTLLIGTDNGFSLYDIESDSFLTQATDHFGETFAVNALEYYPASERIFVGTNNGLLVLHRTQYSMELVGERITDEHGLTHRHVQSLILDEHRTRLYVGTISGVSIIDDLTGETEITPFLDSRYLGQTTVNAILVSTYGEFIFLGTTSEHYGNLRGGLVFIPLSILSTESTEVQAMTSLILVIGMMAIAVTWTKVFFDNRKERLFRADFKLDAEFVANHVSQGIEEPLIEIKKCINTSSRKGTAEFIRDMIAMTNTCLRLKERGLILVGPEEGPEDWKRPFNDDSTYQQIVSSRVKPQISFYFKKIKHEDFTYGGFIIRPVGCKPVSAKKLVDSDGHILIEENACWIRRGTSKTFLNQEEIIELSQELAV